MHKDLEDQTEEEEDQESRCSYKEGGMTINDFSNTYLPTYNKLQLRFSYLLASHPWNFHEPLMFLTIVNVVIFYHWTILCQMARHNSKGLLWKKA